MTKWLFHHDPGAHSIPIKSRIGQHLWNDSDHHRRSGQVKNVARFYLPILIQFDETLRQIRIDSRVFKISLLIGDVPGELFPVRAFHLLSPREPLYAVEKV